MIQVVRDQALQRYDLLSENLKDALFSLNNAEIVRKVGESHHLTEDKIVAIGKIIGYIILGFIHSEDLAQEIKDALNLNSEIANSIAQEIDRKIFALIRSDLEKVYQPAVAEAMAGEPPTEEALDLRAKVEPPTEMEIPKAEEPKVVVEEIQSKAVQPPEVKPQFGEVEPPKIGVGEVEPLIIHKEAEFKPLSETKKSLGGLFGFLRKGKKEEKISPVKAQVEIGEEMKPAEAPQKEEKIAPSGPPKVRVVHYTEFPTPISPFGKTEEELKKEVPAEAEKPAVAEAMAGKKEIKPPENLPIKTEPEAGLIKETKKEEVQPLSIEADKPARQRPEPQEMAGGRGFMQTVETIPKVEEKIQPLDLRKPPAATEAALSGKGGSEVETLLPPKPEESKPTKPEEEEIIDLSSFK